MILSWFSHIHGKPIAVIDTLQARSGWLTASTAAATLAPLDPYTSPEAL